MCISSGHIYDNRWSITTILGQREYVTKSWWNFANIYENEKEIGT